MSDYDDFDDEDDRPRRRRRSSGSSGERKPNPFAWGFGLSTGVLFALFGIPAPAGPLSFLSCCIVVALS